MTNKDNLFAQINEYREKFGEDSLFTLNFHDVFNIIENKILEGSLEDLTEEELEGIVSYLDRKFFIEDWEENLEAYIVFALERMGR